MNPSSAKNKGRKGQKEVVALLHKTFPTLQSDDIKWCSMGAGGEDIRLSPAARLLFPYSIEVKTLKAIAALKYLDQAKANAKEHTALVFMRANRGKMVVLIEADDFLKLFEVKHV